MRCNKCGEKMRIWYDERMGQKNASCVNCQYVIPLEEDSVTGEMIIQSTKEKAEFDEKIVIFFARIALLASFVCYFVDRNNFALWFLVLSIILFVIGLIIDDEKNKHITSYLLLCGGYLVAFFLVILIGNTSYDGNIIDNKPNSYNQTVANTKIPTSTSAPRKTPTPTVMPVSNKNMKISEVGKLTDYKIALVYVKNMEYLTPMHGKRQVDDGHEVIIPFFEFFNSSDDVVSVSPYSITCYADGIQATHVDSSIKSYVDKVHNYTIETIDVGTQLLTCLNFDVIKGWKELRFYYNSECFWIVTSDEVKTENFDGTLLFKDTSNRKITAENTVIYSKDFIVTYAGTEIRKSTGYWQEPYSVILKFRIDNKSDKELNTSLWGYRMRAYQNNVFLGDSVYTDNANYDGFVNIHDIETIAPGMSANIYVEFESEKSNGKIYMTFNIGYDSDDVLGYVNTNLEDE